MQKTPMTAPVLKSKWMTAKSIDDGSAWRIIDKNESDLRLIWGFVLWNRARKKWTFRPNAFTEFQAECLSDLVRFLEELNGKGETGK